MKPDWLVTDLRKLAQTDYSLRADQAALMVLAGACGLAADEIVRLRAFGCDFLPDECLLKLRRASDADDGMQWFYTGCSSGMPPKPNTACISTDCRVAMRARGASNGCPGDSGQGAGDDTMSVHETIPEMTRRLEATNARLTRERDEAQAACAEYRDALARLLQLVRHETNLPKSAANGVTGSSGVIDEGVARADEIMDLSRRALTRPNPGQAILDDLAAAQAVIEWLPRTQNGVVITLNMTLYWVSNNPDTLAQGKQVSSLVVYDDGWDAFWCELDGSEYAMPDDFGLYSTSEAAAEAAESQEATP